MVDHPITNGRSPSERVEHVITDTGQAFRPSPGTRVEPLMVLGHDAVLFMSPDWREEFTDATPRLSAAGWYQGVVLRRGAGRVAAFGEAAMFSAQVGSDGEPMGMNDPEADQNHQFVLNVMHWLSGLLEAGPSENRSTVGGNAIRTPTEEGRGATPGSEASAVPESPPKAEIDHLVQRLLSDPEVTAARDGELIELGNVIYEKIYTSEPAKESSLNEQELTHSLLAGCGP